MPKRAKELSAIEVKRLLKTPGKHAVGGVAGLLLAVSDNAASWKLRVTVGARRREMGLGGYPTVSLARAREKAREQVDKISDGIDPIEEKRELKNALRAAHFGQVKFEQAAEEYHAKVSLELKTNKASQDWFSPVKRYALPVLADMPCSDIDTHHVLGILQPSSTPLAAGTCICERTAYPQRHGREGFGILDTDSRSIQGCSRGGLAGIRLRQVTLGDTQRPYEGRQGASRPIVQCSHRGYDQLPGHLRVCILGASRRCVDGCHHIQTDARH